MTQVTTTPETITRTANSILMVRPFDFGFNEETGLDNEFQSKINLPESEINRRANLEFQAMVDLLRAKGVTVLVLEAPFIDSLATPPLTSPAPLLRKAPDAIFPNNWLSTEHDGTLITYPMKAKSRRIELRIEEVEQLLDTHGYRIRNSIHVGRLHENDHFLEGTGSLIIDHVDEIVYAARSDRCHPDQFANFIKLRFYKEGVLFDTRSSTGKPIYHTNVMMSLGEDFAVVCLECIPDQHQQEKVLSRLSQSFSQVITITLSQVEKFYCGNILALRNGQGDPLIVMSTRAYQGFSHDQRQRLSRCGEIVSVAIDTIETIGGGSARCMMAEIFSARDPGEVLPQTLGSHYKRDQ